MSLATKTPAADKEVLYETNSWLGIGERIKDIKREAEMASYLLRSWGFGLGTASLQPDNSVQYEISDSLKTNFC